MGDFHDMPPLVDNPGSMPTMTGPAPAFASWDSLRTPGVGLAPPQSFSPGPGFLGPSPWPGYDSQAGTPMSWGSSSMMSTPMLAAPAMAVMPNAQQTGFGVSPSSGWPRPLATQEDVDRSPPSTQWDSPDDKYERRLLAPRGNTPTLSRSVSLSSSPSSASLSSRSLSRKTSLRGNAAEAMKRPPREWRTDFSLAGAGFLSGLLGNRARSKSFGGNGGTHSCFFLPRIPTLTPSQSAQYRRRSSCTRTSGTTHRNRPCTSTSASPRTR